MTDPHRIALEGPPVPTMRVILDGVVVGESDDIVVLREGSLPERFYFSPDSVNMDMLEPTQTSTHCPYKGDARYWTVTVNNVVHEDLAWGYDNPIDDVKGIANRICFYNEKLVIEAV